MRFPSSSMFLILKSIPIVVMKVGEKESFAYRRSRQVFPTPAESNNWHQPSRAGFPASARRTTVTDHEQLDLHVEGVLMACHRAPPLSSGAATAAGKENSPADKQPLARLFFFFHTR